MKGGTGIFPGKDVVARMAVCASGYLLRLTDVVNLPVIAFIVGRRRMRGEFIAFGQGFIGMAGLAFFRVGCP